MAHEVEQFFGCYLLYCENPRYKGRTYIGFTVDPNRRLQQHNTGKHKGGAWRTSGRGPWTMVLIVHGFPNEIAALKFEWAWQHPDLSRHLRHIPPKTRKDQGYKYKFKVLSEMLRTSPWNRLALTIRWLNQDYQLEFEPHLAPPVHMAIAYGPVKSVNPKRKHKVIPESSCSEPVEKEDSTLVTVVGTSRTRCEVCFKRFKSEEHKLRCYHPQCSMTSHTLCLARKFLQHDMDELLPISGQCPKCSEEVIWGELVRFKKGCYRNEIEAASTEDDDDHWADQLSQAC